jgi:hypothetical protein
MEGSSLKDRQAELFHAVPYKMSIRTKQSNTQGGLTAGKRVAHIQLKHVFAKICYFRSSFSFDEKFSRHVYLFVMMDSNNPLSPDFLHLYFQYNEAPCRIHACALNKISHKDGQITLTVIGHCPCDCFLRCTTHRQNMVQKESYGMLTKWRGILLAHLKNFGQKKLPGIFTLNSIPLYLHKKHK